MHTEVSSDRVAILVKKLSLKIDKLANRILAPHDLTSSQYKVLKLLLLRPPQSVRQVDVEEYFSMTNPTVTGLINKLEAKGLVARAVNPHDGRSKVLRLTEKTLAMKEKLFLLGEGLENEFTSVLDAQEKAVLLALLKKLCDQEDSSKEETV